MKHCWTSLTCLCWASCRVLRNDGTERRKGSSGKCFGNQLPDYRQRHCHTFERCQMTEKGGWGGGRLYCNTWQVSCFFPTQTNASQKKLEQNRLQCQQMQSAWAACALVSCSLYCCSTKMQIIFLRLHHSGWTFHEQQDTVFSVVCVSFYVSPTDLSSATAQMTVTFHWQLLRKKTEAQTYYPIDRSPSPVSAVPHWTLLH